MPAFNFKKRFAPAVEAGIKRQTIRRAFPRGAGPGAPAYLYTGMRTRQCRKLGEGVITNVLAVEIGRHECSEPYCHVAMPTPRLLVHGDLDTFARDDGFRDAEEMVAWFEEQGPLPFKGWLTLWVPNQ